VVVVVEVASSARRVVPTKEADIWRIPGGVVHRVRALDHPAVALDVFHPIREDYL
jgi:hypothetical protein